MDSTASSPRVAAPRERWTTEEAKIWAEAQPWIVGCNFVPSTAVNQLEMWQAETFDLPTLERELHWASEIGFNTVRVYLHDLPWLANREAFLDRVDRFLTLAEGAGIRVMLVLFDGVWDPEPRPGPQRAPRPHVHNSGWVQSPGREILDDPARHPKLEEFVSSVIGRFREDPRILAWDLFNEPDNPNPAYQARETPRKEERARELLARTFDWARRESPQQPLTAAVWRGPWSDPDALSEINRLMLGESDILSFHDYSSPEHVRRSIEVLERYGRPLICSEYLARELGNTFEAVLPIFREHGVGAINWGLVAGKTQTHYPWTSWVETFTAEPDLWYHDVLRPDGRPYREAEIDLIRRLSRQG